MSETLVALYPWIKAFHIIAVIAWMAGMLYLPRLFVYHCETSVGTPEYERFALMERKLMRIIINPSMIAVWVLGLTLASTSGAWTQGWFHLKLLLVTGLSAFHGMMSAWRRAFEQGNARRRTAGARTLGPTMLWRIPAEDFLRHGAEHLARALAPGEADQLRDGLTTLLGDAFVDAPAERVALCRFEAARARALLEPGVPLGRRLGGRIGRSIALFARGGMAALDALERADWDVFSGRPAPSKLTFLRLTAAQLVRW